MPLCQKKTVLPQIDLTTSQRLQLRAAPTQVRALQVHAVIEEIVQRVIYTFVAQSNAQAGSMGLKQSATAGVVQNVVFFVLKLVGFGSALSPRGFETELTLASVQSLLQAARAWYTMPHPWAAIMALPTRRSCHCQLLQLRHPMARPCSDNALFVLQREASLKY